MTPTEIIFFLSLIILLYVYGGYPLGLKTLSLFMRRGTAVPVNQGESTPAVSLIIAAYNEEAVIAEKIENSLSLEYPGEKLEILVFSDGSTDRTNEIVARYSARGVTLLPFPERHGKTECQNRVASLAKGDVIVFSDANSIYERQAIRKLARHFVDPQVGCVCGRLVYTEPGGQDSAGFYEQAFMRYLQGTKGFEAAASAPVGANGAIYAMRRDLFEPIPKELLEDLVRPVRVMKRGYRVRYEPEAVCSEPATAGYRHVWKKKSRIAKQSLATLLYEKDILNPLKHGLFAVQVLTKSILRRVGLIFALILLISNATLLMETDRAPFYAVALAVQILGWLWGLFGLLWITLLEGDGGRARPRALGILLLPGNFLLANAAALWGYLTYIVGHDSGITWEKAR